MNLSIATFRGVLLAGVAAVALVGQPALAEDPVTGPKMWRPDSFWIEIEGAYQWVSGAKQPWVSDNISEGSPSGQSLFSIRSNGALQGRVEVGFKINQRWDVAVAYTGLRENKKKGSRTHDEYLYNVLGPYKSYYDDASVETRVTMHVADFEIGYEVGLGTRGLVRLHVGIRFARFNNEANTQFVYDDALYFTESLNNSNWGIGPRIGASGKFRIRKTSRGIFSIVGAVSGSVLFGRSSSGVSQQFVDWSGPNGTGSENYNKTSAATIFNVEGKVGIAYSFPLGAWGATFTLGYRGSAWWNVANTQTSPNLFPGSSYPTSFPGAGSKSGNRFYHGPFVSFRVNF